MSTGKIAVFGTFTLAVMVMALVVPMVGADDELPLNMRANAGISTRGTTSMVDISITEWTTEEERQRLLAHAKEHGTQSLREELQKLSSKGRVNPRGGLGINWRYAFQYPKAGGRTIILAADRPVNVGEAIGQGVVGRDHDLTLAIIELDDQGDGAGTLVLAARLDFGADGRLEVTQAGQNPVHLGRVRVLN